MSKISEITLEDIKDVNRIDYSDDDLYIKNTIMPAAIQYIKGYTGLTDEQIDLKPDLTIAYIVLATDMINNKDYQVQNNKTNVVVESILNRYCVNLL